MCPFYSSQCPLASSYSSLSPYSPRWKVRTKRPCVSSRGPSELFSLALVSFLLLCDVSLCATLVTVKYPLSAVLKNVLVASSSPLSVASALGAAKGAAAASVQSRTGRASQVVSAVVSRRCPLSCSCKWKGGKKTAQCSNLGLDRIPGDMDLNTQVLDLSSNPIITLTDRVFLSNGLTDLQRIYLSRCQLREIERDTFESVSNLVELDLGHNYLRTVPSEAFRPCRTIRKLLLNHNPIHRLNQDSFQAMASLWTLDLSHCDIELIEPKAFNDLTQLKNLHLNDNKLRVLAGSVVEPLVHVDQLNLNLHGNHWICDCRLRDLRHWMLSHKIPLSFTPTCDYPSRLTGRSWSDLELDEFACPPELSVPSGQVYSFEGEDARLECIGRSIPSAAIDWFWKGRPIGNLSLMSFGRQMYLIKETVKGTDKTSSLYIVNAMPKDSGSYTCRASNKAGTLMSNVSLEVTLSKRDQVVEQSGQSMVGLVLAIVLVLTVILLAVMYVVIRHKQAIVSTFQSSERKDVIVNHHQNGRPGTSGRAASGQQQIETVIASQAALSSLATMANGQRQASGSSLSPITVPMAIMAANLASDDEAPPPPAPNQDYLQMTSNDIQDRNKYNVRLTEMYNRKSTPPDIMDNNGLFRPNGGPVTSPVLI